MRAVNYSLVTNQRFYPPPHHTGRDGRVYYPSKNAALLKVEQQKFKSSHNCSNHLSCDGKIPSFKTTSGRRLKSGLDEAARANFSQQRAVNAASGLERGRNCQFVGLFFFAVHSTVFCHADKGPDKSYRVLLGRLKCRRSKNTPIFPFIRSKKRENTPLCLYISALLWSFLSATS